MPLQDASPGIVTTEIDLTASVPSVSTTEGAITSMFRWGPLNQRVLVTSEDQLVSRFFSPNANNANRFFTATSFLAYSNALYAVRVATEASAKNATAANSQGTLIKNDEHYELSYPSGVTSAGAWVAKYPGVIGNSLKVSICARPDAFQRTLTGTVTVTANSAVVTGSGTKFSTQVVKGDYLTINGLTNKVLGITNTTSLTLESRHTAGASGNTVIKRWEFYSYADQFPRTSAYANTAGGKLDEAHIAVVDEDGVVTGVQNAVLEIFPNCSLAVDAQSDDGSSTYYKNVINSKSKWIRWANHEAALTSAGSAASGVTFGGTANVAITRSLVGGNDGGNPTNADYQRGYDLFKDPDAVDVSFILGGDATQTLGLYLINNIAETRKDCLVVLSPPRSSVVNNAGNEADSISTYRDTLPSTSYAVLDSGWKYMYDRYNDINRYVPLNGDVAGTMVFTDTVRDPWFSPAGFNRGNIKNCIKLAYNPTSKTERNILYKKQINPVVTFPSDGTVLFGDKTMLNSTSAFSRINVRRLFIVLRKAVARASTAQLFDNNTDFTRAQFVNLVEPFLRTIQGRQGIYDFKVVCDETNNTGEVIDNNDFVGDIYVKPARSINNIQLNFVATRTDVDFQEIVGKI